jgi:hypothetical protein
MESQVVNNEIYACSLFYAFSPSLFLQAGIPLFRAALTSDEEGMTSPVFPRQRRLDKESNNASESDTETSD